MSAFQHSNSGNNAIDRRRVLRSLGGLSAAAALGVVGPGAVARAAGAAASKIRLAWTEVAACHAATAFGVARGFFAKKGLDVELFNQGASGQTLIQALATDKADVGIGLVLDFLKPLEQGFDVKLLVGSHGGCQRLLASKASGVTSIQGLKGKTIAVADLAGPSKLAFAVTLAKSGLDPDTDVTWRVFSWDLVGEAVNKGEADALAQFDPWAAGYEKSFNLVRLADTQTGFYQDRVCCVLGVNGPFLEANREALRRLAEANLEAHDYAGKHPDEVAKYYFDLMRPNISLEDLTADIASFTNHVHPIGGHLVHQIQESVEDLKLIKVIDRDTDAAAFAKRVTVDILA